jgi:hypothetical protein
VIDEGFEKTEGMAIRFGPVQADVFDIKGQELGGQMRDFNIREN